MQTTRTTAPTTAAAWTRKTTIKRTGHVFTIYSASTKELGTFLVALLHSGVSPKRRPLNYQSSSIDIDIVKWLRRDSCTFIGRRILRR